MTHGRSTFLRRYCSPLFALVALLACSAAARAVDTYDGVKLTIPTLYAGNATYSDVVVTVGRIISGPSVGTGATGDIYLPAAGTLTIASVMVGDSTYFNVVITVKAVVSIGSVSGADTYAGSRLTTSQIQIGNAIYNDVVLAVTPADIVRVDGGMPLALWDQYTPSTGQLLIPAVQVGGTVYTNVTIKASPKEIVGIGGANAPQLTALSPNLVNAGGGAFQVIVTGNNFDANSLVEWNGNYLSTQLNSPTQLIAYVDASEIASPGSNAVLVTNYENAGPLASSILPFTVASSSTPTVASLSSQGLSLSADASMGGQPLVNNPFTLVVNGGAVNSTYYYSISYVGTAVSQLTMNGVLTSVTGTTAPSGPTAGRITGNAYPGEGGLITGSFIGQTVSAVSAIAVTASLMGAGTYADTITANVCTDPQCTHPLAGSPVIIPVTYTVTGNPISNAEFSLYNGPILLEAASSATSGPSTTVTISSNSLPPYGAYIVATSGTGAAIASASAQSNLNGTATLTVTARPPAALGSGIYVDSVQLNICFDATCTKPANHFPMTIPVRYVVDASPGVDFTAKTIPGEVAAMAWSPLHQRLYAVTPGYAALNPHSLLVINPQTATIESIVSLGDTGPIFITLSDDGQYAYVALQVTNQVVRVRLSTLTIDQTLTLSTTTDGLLEGISVAPGAAHTLAVVADNANDMTLAVYDDTVQRPQTFRPGSLESPLFITWGANAGTMFAYDKLGSTVALYELSASTGGLAIAQTYPGIAFELSYINNILYDNGLVYSNTGSVFDPATAMVRAAFNLTSSYGGVAHAGSVTLDDALNRAYVVTDDHSNLSNVGLTIEGFDLATGQPTWVSRSSSGVGNLLRWGTNGLAFTSGSVLAPSITLISGSIVSR